MLSISYHSRVLENVPEKGTFENSKWKIKNPAAHPFATGQ
jgi:hypothetical protein